MTSITSKFTTAAVIVALCVAPTSAIAASPVASAPARTASAGSISPWVSLGAMSTGSAAVASTAQDRDYDADGRPGFPPLPVLAVILATLAVAIYILVKDDDDDGAVITLPPVSPN